MENYIEIRGSKVNNLKNISCKIPRNKLTVITGLSGSGKSSLAFDTIFAEGQRRYVESLSSFARQFLGVLEKPHVDEIKGLSPALSIDQKTAVRSPRSTVGTMSEIYDHLRLMFSHIATIKCMHCHTKMKMIEYNSEGGTKNWQCPKCKYMMSGSSISSFSFNSPEGACPECQGLGVKLEIDPRLVVPNTKLTINEGAIRPWQRMVTGYVWQKQELEKLSKKMKFSFDAPIYKLASKNAREILYGSLEYGYEGVIPNLERKHKETNSEYIRKEIERYMVKKICPGCKGARLKNSSLMFEINGISIADYSRMSIDKLKQNIGNLLKSKTVLTYEEKEITRQLLLEMSERVSFMQDVGLNYLTLDRSSDTLAGGEAQRIRLATQLGSSLIGVVYILDEPTIGLHPKDQGKMIECLLKLRNLGNTVIVVEHEKLVMEIADYIIDIGPLAGDKGGEIVAEGTMDMIKKSKSLTADFLTGKQKIFLPAREISQDQKYIAIQGAQEFNLKDISVNIPVGRLTAVTGVSGSGKSTLIDNILVRSLKQKFYNAKSVPGKYKSIIGTESINKIINITQAPIGRNVRSNPATYTGLLSLLRDLFSKQELAVKRRYTPAYFSFNLKIGRCEYCRGDGMLKFEMHFLPDVYVMCKSCRGKRYNPKTLDIKYKNQDISEVLKMTVDQATNFFFDQPQILQKLKVLQKVGLGYLHLDQNAPDLSGGEAQRIKLATELSRASTGQTLYILDEPTTGLHFADIKKLLVVLSGLVDKGNTVVVIEHNIDVIKNADWVIDLGPEGGDKGGELIFEGTITDLKKCKKSYTGKFLQTTK
ncbi:excinuclease ABC subunit A [Candidatus Berkelbacteria bacterium CG_4_9_14_3_um_filter_39_23]|uniref:UvrABC system protein A n=2 Tax=Candidatus Berkelbacteria TaxID=1618330 RepID=A0A2M7CIV4_9BACT|nr:MAG: excinuclease ABC subunit A [Candidatus Berkelbacteria bacterium CG2_30_39_44]PIR28003.1 MAG: excinuclease ABC subunit A [Candidatus Berkelbacteria bacterium CG11_big_fil_rev_8_21_14_0_20_40_23]PIV25577.1 MAG: excinuclease ABC subunit A [Candidatus Berkelbacteria bacterium CG03_land_8_20_14_0_80_40_36]PIX30459.1 MAG: excinuclease ABC subunit A [Candidatus Berkelbacteria bacterium CG_4_8_14_3_um_filter_39_27]PIZ28807.1 MAG: excinuclease ABC subunit A [Candidatus Berkelbacteria bacterium C